MRPRIATLLKIRLQKASTAWCRAAPPGESATLTHEEHERVIEICIDQARGRVPVLARGRFNNTAEAIRLARFAKKAEPTGRC